MRKKEVSPPLVRIEMPGRSSIVRSGRQTRDEDFPYGPKKPKVSPT